MKRLAKQHTFQNCPHFRSLFQIQNVVLIWPDCAKCQEYLFWVGLETPDCSCPSSSENKLNQQAHPQKDKAGTEWAPYRRGVSGSPHSGRCLPRGTHAPRQTAFTSPRVPQSRAAPSEASSRGGPSEGEPTPARTSEPVPTALRAPRVPSASPWSRPCRPPRPGRPRSGAPSPQGAASSSGCASLTPPATPPAAAAPHVRRCLGRESSVSGRGGEAKRGGGERAPGPGAGSGRGGRGRGRGRRTARQV